MKFDHTLTDTEMREIRTGREEIWQSRFFTVTKDTVLLPSGRTSTREVAWKRGAVAVIPVTDDGKIICVEQFRYPYDRVILEIPAGKMDEGETDPLVTAKRELTEECGLTADNFIDLGEMYPTVGYCSEIIYIWAATGLHEAPMNLDEGEFLTPERIPLQKAYEMVMSGEIQDGKTVVAVLKIKALIDAGKVQLG